MKKIIGNSILIAGFGREGQSVLKYVEKKHPNFQITVADKDPKKLVNCDKYKSMGGSEYLNTACQYNTVVRSPGISIRTPELQNLQHITTATNLFFSECLGVVIGITGTKGKSTTSSLIYHIMKTAHKDTRLVGNIGYPALDALDGTTNQTIFIAELSSYQLEDLKYSPHIAVVLPIVPEHLNYHGDFNGYVDAKSHIANNQTEEDFIVFYGQSAYSRYIANKSIGTKIPYAEKDDNNSISVWFEEDAIWIRTEKGNPRKLIRRNEIPLLGNANLDNVMAAVVVGLIVDISEDEMREAIRTFKSLEHRLEAVGTYSDIIFYNDSLATIPEATAHALEALGDKVTTLIAGGYDRGIDMSSLGKVISDSSVINLILFPTTGNKIAQAVRKVGLQRSINIVMVQTMEEAVKNAYKLTTKGTVCLMSPAASSFNLFKDYADRGNRFKEYIRKYKN